MDEKELSDRGARFDAAVCIVTIVIPPIMFGVAWIGTNLYEWATAADGIGWRGRAGFGFLLVLFALFHIMDTAMPTSVRHLKVITACLLIYGSLIVWFFTLTEGRSPWTGVFFSAVVVLVSYWFYRRRLGKYRNNFDVRPTWQLKPRRSNFWRVAGEGQHQVPAESKQG
jgi:hypothetical protein